MKIRHLLFVISFLAAFLLPVTPAKALASIDQMCQTIPANEPYTFLTHEPAQIFIPTKNTLDAISVRVKADIGAQVLVKAEVIGADQSPYPTIASKTISVTNTASWVIFDFDDASMPYGTYGIQLTDASQQGHAIWYHGAADCYDRGYAVYDNQYHPEFDYRFAVYAYDASSGQPSGTAAPQTSTGSNPQGATSSTKSQTSKNANINSSLGNPSEIAKNLSEHSIPNDSNDSSSPLSGILFFLVRLIPLLVIFFIGLVLFIAWLFIFRKKKPAAPPTTTQNKK